MLRFLSGANIFAYSVLFSTALSAAPPATAENQTRVMDNIDRASGALFDAADTTKDGQLDHAELAKIERRVMTQVRKFATTLRPAMINVDAPPADLTDLEFVKKEQFAGQFRSLVKQAAVNVQVHREQVAIAQAAARHRALVRARERREEDSERRKEDRLKEERRDMRVPISGRLSRSGPPHRVVPLGSNPTPVRPR